jgi:hypothetical protein
MRKAREAFEQRQALLPSPDKLLKSSKSSIGMSMQQENLDGAIRKL